MFYDDVFRRITEGSAFSEEAALTLSSQECTLKGFFCSGSYGDKGLDKGYTTDKTVNRQAFKVSADSLPEGAVPKDLMRQVLTIRGRKWTVRDVTGNDSGILNLDLIPSGGNA